jgi:hypothetical protein
MFSDEKWAAKPDSDIAKHTGIPRRTVCDHRQRYLGESARIDSGQREVTRNGTTYKMNTSRIGPANRPKKPTGRSRRSPEISPHARMPTRRPGKFQARVNIDIPHDPNAAARVILSTLGNEFARELITELTSQLQ